MTDVKIRCDDCKFQENCVDYGWQDCKKFTPKPSEQMTNEEWFCELSTEEKAEYLADKFNEVVDFVLHEVDENAEDIEPDDYWYRQDVIVEWLKQPHHSKE